MLNPLVDSRDVRFVLFELLEADKLTGYPRFSQFDRDTFESILDLFERVAVEKLYPEFAISDREGCAFNPSDASVKCPDGLKRGLKAYHDGGFIGIVEDPAIGGMGMPELIRCVGMEYFSAANQPLVMYPALAHGAMDLILKFGTDEQKKKYVPKIMAGEWGGTMCLTEPQAGSDVGALQAKAVRQADGTYRITGQKIFISAGENDVYDNMIHPVLARVEGDPSGTRGISIFIVPKYIVNDDGTTGGHNDVHCTGIEHKMGLKSSCTCTMSFGDNGNCIGYLLGQERQGMKIMFRMMNDFRMGTAVQAQGVSSAAYLHAAAYACNRVQGPHIAQMMNPDAKGVAIVEHPDVARMLLWMKSYVDAQRMLIYYMFYNMDMAKLVDGEDSREAQALVDLMVPVCKAGCSDRNVLVTGEAMQVLGGYGFCQDYPIEQMMRNSKILAIFEGANGIQGIDLVMRKILMNPDQYNYRLWEKKIRQTIASARGVVDDLLVNQVEKGLEKMNQVMEKMKTYMTGGRVPDVFASATPFRKAMYMMSLAWMHLWSLCLTVPALKKVSGGRDAVALREFIKDNDEAAFYAGRVTASRFFILKEFPEFCGMADAIMRDENPVLAAQAGIFHGAPAG